MSGSKLPAIPAGAVFQPVSQRSASEFSQARAAGTRRAFAAAFLAASASVEPVETAELVRVYLRSCAAGGLRPKTISAYSWALARLPAATPAPIEDYETALGDPALSQQSRSNMWTVWRTFAAWAEVQRGIPNVVALVRRPKAPRRLPRTFTQSELGAIWRACEEGAIVGCKTPERALRLTARNRAMVGLLLDTGIRLGELSGLRWGDVSIGQLRVTGKRGMRTVPLSPEAQGLLVGVGDRTHLWVGPKGPLTDWGVSLALGRIAKRAGLDGAFVRAHTYRHTFATEFLRATGNLLALRDALGHSSVTVTQVYPRMVPTDVAALMRDNTALRGLTQGPGGPLAASK